MTSSRLAANVVLRTCNGFVIDFFGILPHNHPARHLQGQRVSEETVIYRIGPANFEPNDFVIFNKLGNVSVRRVSTGNVLGSADDDSLASIRVNVFAATYESGRPFEGPATVLLKEYLPGSWDVGLNELQIRASIEV
jgi:hypothetical protein